MATKPRDEDKFANLRAEIALVMIVVTANVIDRMNRPRLEIVSKPVAAGFSLRRRGLKPAATEVLKPFLSPCPARFALV